MAARGEHPDAGLSVIGARLAFALPLDLRANWIFRIMPPPEVRDYLVARRRAMLAVGVVPGVGGIRPCSYSPRGRGGRRSVT